MRSYLKNYLESISGNLPQEISLITDEQNSVTAISAGAVLRADNKENGPERISDSSYGFLRTEPYQPEVFAAHREADPFRDEVDGQLYVETIVFFMFKGQTILYKHEFPAFPVLHTFEISHSHFLCEEELYVSDVAKESHYTLKHPKNRGVTELAGSILLDMTWLRDQKKLYPVPLNDNDGRRGKKIYRVEYQLVAMVQGRNLRYEARYEGLEGMERQAKQVSIAAAFRPGTK